MASGRPAVEARRARYPLRRSRAGVDVDEVQLRAAQSAARREPEPRWSLPSIWAHPRGDLSREALPARDRWTPPRPSCSNGRPRPRKRSQTPARAGACHSSPTRSAGYSSSIVAPRVRALQASAARGSDGCPASSASAARGRNNPLPIAPAEATSSDLRVIRRALIVVYDTTRPGQVASQFMRIR